MPKSRTIAIRQVPGAPKIDLRSLPEVSPAPHGAQEAPREHPKRSQHAPRSSRDRPSSIPGAPGESPGAAPSVRKSGRERPGALRGDQNRRRGASGTQKSEFFACAALAHRLRSDYSTIFIDFRIFRKMQKCSNVLRLPVKIKVRHFALRGEALARCDLEKHHKST